MKVSLKMCSKFIDNFFLILGTSPALAILLVASLQVGTIAYGAGVGSIPYTMVGEVFTPEYKTVGTCVVQSVRLEPFSMRT